MRALLTLLLLLLPTAAQQAQPTAKDPKKESPGTEGKEKVEPLPKGEKRIFEAIVIDVQGAAQARSSPKGKWRKLKLNDVVKPGTVIRTGRKSHVALRVGPNASMLIERQSRIAIPEIVQDGDVLRTRVSMSFGKTDVRVDRIGLDNDFEVATPTATLAVRGTTFRIVWDAIGGCQAIGVPGNRLRAIEVKYITGIDAVLSQADSTSDRYQLPAIRGYYDTYYKPLKGAIDETVLDDPEQNATGFVEDPARQTGVASSRKARGSVKGSTDPTGSTGQQAQEED